MDIKNLKNGEVVNNVKIVPTNKVYSSSANESEVEAIFEDFLKDIGYGTVGGLYTKRTAKSKLDIFPSKTGNGSGYPDYVFYENEYSERIIAIGDAKKPDIKGSNNSINGLSDCKDIYLKDYNKKHKSKIRICFGYDGLNFIIKYLNENDEWLDITIDDEPITTMPCLNMLLSIHKNGNKFSTQIQKNISKEALEPYFEQCDIIFRRGKNSLSAIDKAAEISIFIFLKIFSSDKLDEEFKEEHDASIWELIEQGKIDIINKVFKDFLNKRYEKVFPEKLIRVNSETTKELAKTINIMFNKCKIDRMTDVKGNALEYYQKDSKDKKIGEFFTPRHIIDMIVFLVNPQIKFEKDEDGNYILNEYGNRKIESIEKIYDPACGSGGFLIYSFLSYIEKYGQYGVTNKDLRTNVIFGNELKDSTVMLTKLNMILLGDGHNHISNENALSYKKVKKLEKLKNEKEQHIILDDSDVIYKEERNGTDISIVPYDKNTNDPVIVSKSDIKYFISDIGKNKKLKKKKDKDGKYTEIDSKHVDRRIDSDGKETFFVKDSDVQLIKVGRLKELYFRAKVKTKKDGINPQIDYIDVKAVNDKVKKYHNKFFGKFDIVMANHPYGLDEPNKPDEYFIKHMIESTKKGGRIACIVGETVLFHKAYKSFREHILSNYAVEAIISLPQGVFNPYTDVKTSILLINRSTSPIHHKTWLVDLQSDGFELNSQRNAISNNDIPKVKRLWEKWGGYTIENENGKEEFKSFHKEEVGFAEFHKLDKKNWCVKRYNTPLISLKSKYDLYPINEILKRKKESIDIKDDIEYKQVTIQVKNRGIVLRESQFGEDIGTKKQFTIRKGQFLISKIDARNGAYGIVPAELDGAIITGNFWTFNINTERVYPGYLNYLMRHKFFLKMCTVCSYGSTNRWYLDEDTFNNFKVPIPSKEEQKQILQRIKEHAKKINDANGVIKKENERIMNIINEIVN